MNMNSVNLQLLAYSCSCIHVVQSSCRAGAAAAINLRTASATSATCIAARGWLIQQANCKPKSVVALGPIMAKTKARKAPHEELRRNADLQTLAVYDTLPPAVRDYMQQKLVSSQLYSPASPSLSPDKNAASCATPSPAKKAPRTSAKLEGIAQKKIAKKKHRKLFPKNHQ